ELGEQLPSAVGRSRALQHPRETDQGGVPHEVRNVDRDSGHRGTTIVGRPTPWPPHLCPSPARSITRERPSPPSAHHPRGPSPASAGLRLSVRSSSFLGLLRLLVGEVAFCGDKARPAGWRNAHV